ncbi:hypothetical protein WA538_004764 [Blastocystis sp. DL]
MEGDSRLHSGYLYFCNEQQSLLHSKNPDLPPHELSKLLEEQWQSIPLSDKMRYAKLSAIASSRYTANLDDRFRSIYLKPREDRSSRKEKDYSFRTPLLTPALPKKARSAYIFYCLKHRSRIQGQNESISPVEVSRRLGAEWNALSPEEREPYKKMEAEDRQRYLHDLAERGITMEDVKRCTRNSTASASRAKSAYLYFCSLKREEIHAQNSQLSSNDINKHLNAMWSNMTDEERAPYEANAFDDKERIKREVEKVRQSIKDGFVVPTSKPKRTKRARTSYTLFYKEKMAQLRGENENLGFGEISKKLADEWKSLSDEQKQVYVDRSHQEQEMMHNVQVQPRLIDSQGEEFQQYVTQRMSELKQEKPDVPEETLHSMIEQEWTSARERHPAEMKPEDYDVYSSAKEVDLPQDQDTHAPMILEERGIDPLTSRMLSERSTI